VVAGAQALFSCFGRRGRGARSEIGAHLGDAYDLRTSSRAQRVAQLDTGDHEKIIKRSAGRYRVRGRARAAGLNARVCRRRRPGPDAAGLSGWPSLREAEASGGSRRKASACREIGKR
jgi:hypothetical protein